MHGPPLISVPLHGVGAQCALWVGQRSLNDAWASTDFSTTSWSWCPMRPLGGRWAHVVSVFSHRLLVIGGIDYPSETYGPQPTGKRGL